LGAGAAPRFATFRPPPNHMGGDLHGTTNGGGAPFGKTKPLLVGGGTVSGLLPLGPRGQWGGVGHATLVRASLGGGAGPHFIFMEEGGIERVGGGVGWERDIPGNELGNLCFWQGKPIFPTSSTGGGNPAPPPPNPTGQVQSGISNFPLFVGEAVIFPRGHFYWVFPLPSQSDPHFQPPASFP